MPKGIAMGTKRRKGTSSSDEEPATFIGFQNENPNPIPGYVKFVYISVVGVTDIRKLNMGLYKSITSWCGDVKSARYTNRNSLLVETMDRKQLNQLVQMKSIINGMYQVRIEPALQIGTTTGIIYAPDLMDMNEIELLELVQEKNDKAITIKRINKGPEKIKTPLLKITFGQESLPVEVRIGYLQFKVNPYYPNPLRCFNCKRFGHTNANCRNTYSCNHCTENHPDSECINQNPKCINCKETYFYGS